MTAVSKAYIDVLATSDDGARTATLAVEYGDKVAKINLDLGALKKNGEPIAALVKREVHHLIDALEAVDASVDEILDQRPSNEPGVQVSTSGARLSAS